MHESYRDFLETLEQKLQGPLPGLPSQMRMATMRRAMRDGKQEIPRDARKAGVLILFYLKENRIHLPFIKRNEYPGVHSGQISFPGGSWESGDENIVATALREAEEEIGIPQASVKSIGMLTNLYIPPSNFLVTPVIGFTESMPLFTPDPNEVERVLEVPLENILAEDAIRQKDITIFPDIRLNVPCFYYDAQVIWGATAMILCELVDLINPGS